MAGRRRSKGWAIKVYSDGGRARHNVYEALSSKTATTRCCCVYVPVRALWSPLYLRFEYTYSYLRCQAGAIPRRITNTDTQNAHPSQFGPGWEGAQPMGF